MTSGQFHSFEVNRVTVNRDARQRRELREIDVLAESIHRLGLIHPVVVTREGVLVAGERRIAAVKSLGWTHVSVQYTDELDTHGLRAIELEENVKRADLPWQDQIRALEEYHALRLAQDPKWNQERTAEAIGFSPRHVDRCLSVANGLRHDPALAEVPKLSVAVGRVERTQQRARAQIIDTLRAVEDEAPPTHPFLNEDFNEWQREYSGPQFNFIHCDFPYGIGADGFNQGSAPAHGGYDDSPATYWQLIASLGEFIQRGGVADHAHLMFWFSMTTYQVTMEALSAQGWIVHPHPLVWVKSDNAGILPDPNRGPRRLYETAFHCIRGDRFVVGPVGNAISAPTVRERHMSEKPEAVLRHFFRMYCDTSTLLLDPTAGSGSALRAARTFQVARAVGIEINIEFFHRAIEAYNEPE